MPRVPTYDTLQVEPSPQPNVQFRAPDQPDVVGRQSAQMGEGLMRLGGAVGKIAADLEEQANKARIADAVNQVESVAMEFEIEARKLKGKNALERPDGVALPDEFGNKFSDRVRQVSESLGNDTQKRAFGQYANRIGLRLRGALAGHMVEEQGRFADETDANSINNAIKRASISWGDPGGVRDAMQTVQDVIYRAAERKGWDQETQQAKLREAMTPIYGVVIDGMITAKRTTDARKYFTAVEAEMSPQVAAKYRKEVIDADDSVKADTKAEEIWNAHKPADLNGALKPADMAAAARAAFPESPDMAKRVIEGLQQRESAWNRQQAEVTAQSINTLFDLHSAKVPMEQIRLSQAWRDATGKGRAEFEKGVKQEEWLAEQREAARAARAAANSQRQLAELQIRDRMLVMTNPDQFLEYSAASKLATMSEGEVRALRATFGFEATQQLLTKWESIRRSPEDLTSARMDDDSFRRIAKEFGYNAYSNISSDREKVGNLKYQIERAIAAEQVKEKRKLTEEQKVNVMRREFGKETRVEYKGFPLVPFTGGSEQVIKLTPSERARVIVPAERIPAIREKLRELYVVNGDPRFADTPDNIRDYYLRDVSATAGDLIPTKK